jgi:DNA polymerase-3 subunit delta'
MAKRTSAKEAAQVTPGILPLPSPVVRHHGDTLFGLMREWKQQSRIPPVLLMTGTAGTGKRNLGYWLAQWILCERNGFAKPLATSDGNEEEPFTSSLFGDALPSNAPLITSESESPSESENENAHPGPCGDCVSCLRALRGNWVDFTEVLPEDSDREANLGGTLKVDQFRKIKSMLGFGAHEGVYKIVLIPNADRMTTQAANSVLKLLEEPPRGWIFFLTASDPTLVLPTILSRCQALRLKPFNSRDLRELLQIAGVDSQRYPICAELAEGSWTKALTLASDEAWQQRQILFAFLKEPATQLSALVDWAALAPANFDLLVDQLEQFASELIRWSVGPDTAHPDRYPWVSLDGKTALVAHAKAVLQSRGSAAAARDFWIERAERLARSRQEALAPLNRKILIQDLLLPWLKAF